MTFTVSGTSGLTFPNASTQSVAATAGLGGGQTWQNVTASRASGTTYTNSTGKPIMVSLVAAWPSYNNQGGYVDGTLVWWWGITNNYAVQITWVMVVPAGSTYRCDGVTAQAWMELR